MPDSHLDLIRQAAVPLLKSLPDRGWLPHALVRKADGKLDKPPRGGATTSNPASWFTLDDAISQWTGRNDVAGIGFAIVPGIIGLDYDDCRDPITGELTDDVQFELERMNSFAYVTPSHRGIRIVGLSTGQVISGGKCNRFLPSGRKIEIFVGPTNHFNTFTSEIIRGYETLRDISDEVIDYLANLRSSERKDAGPSVIASGADPQRGMPAIIAALRSIPNDHQDWDEWCRVGMAVWRSGGGSNEALEAWRDWSARHAVHEDNACDERWRHWSLVSPPTRIGFGTLHHMARQANPLFVAPVDGVTSEVVESAIAAGPEATSGDIFATLDISGLCALPPVEWLLGGVITTDGFAVLYGPPGSLKSFLALAWALHIASGTDWLDKPVRQCGVLYVAGEGVRGMGRRVRAWMRHNNLEGVDLPFRLLPTSVNLTDAAQVAKLIRTAKAAAAAEGCEIGLVIIDTVARAIPGADENSAQDMGRFVAAVEQVKAENGGAILGVHHSGKDVERGARGSSAMLGAVDTMVSVKRNEERLTVTIEKQKDDDEGPPIRLKTLQIELMRGLLVENSLVLESDGDKPPPPRMDNRETLGRIAAALGPNGRLTTRKLSEAIGVTSGRGITDIGSMVPLSPDYIEIDMPSGPVRLARTRVSDASNSPIEVVRYDV